MPNNSELGIDFNTTIPVSGVVESSEAPEKPVPEIEAEFAAAPKNRISLEEVDIYDPSRPLLPYEQDQLNAIEQQLADREAKKTAERQLIEAERLVQDQQEEAARLEKDRVAAVREEAIRQASLKTAVKESKKLPTNNAAFMAANTVDIQNIDARKAEEGGFYSRYNTQASQTFGGAVGKAISKGISGALPDGFKTDVNLISDFRLGTFLRRHGNVTGDQASIINSIIDYTKADKEQERKFIIPRFNHTARFIPIVIKTDFNLSSANTDNKINQSSGRTPFYVVFDSTPESISLSKGASWAPKEFYGRPEPIQIYQSSGAVQFSLKGTFFSLTESDHKRNLQLERSLFALVTPSKNHFMPSPVEVRIGSWKRFHCIVTQVSIDYRGPWKMDSKNEIDSKNNNIPLNAPIPAHAPFTFEVTFNFTIVSELNITQYAEDIMDVGYNGGFAESLEPGNKQFDDIIEKDANLTDRNSLYSVDVNRGVIEYSSSGFAGLDGTLVNVNSYFANTAGYLKSLGLPTDSNGASKSAALAGITTGLSHIVQDTVTKKYGSQISKIFGKK